MSASQIRQLALSDMQEVVGQDHAREAGPEDTVDGVTARYVVEPGSIEEASRILKLAHSAGLAVAPRGAGTKMDLGNPLSHLDLILSTARLNEVLEHAAGDLVVRAQAGVTLDSVQHMVCQARQRLALDPPEKGATLGGIIAANASGPLRLRFGTVRDLLIGITYVLPDGTVAKSGGRVVKNVAGYDLGKLFTGSLGTLGLLLEVIFRLHPLPAAQRTVSVRLKSPDSIDAAVQAILHSSLVPHALEYTWEAEGSLVILFEGIEPGVAAQAERAVKVLGRYGEAHILFREEEKLWWEDRRSAPAPAQDGEAFLKINTLTTDVPIVIDYLMSKFDRHVLRMTGHAGTAVSFVRLAGEPAELAEVIRRIRTFICGRGGSVVVRRAPLSLKREIDVWDPVGSALPLMRRVKAQFDPEGIMNPGRFVGEI